MIGRNPKATLLRVVIWAVACLVVFRLLLLPVRVDGISMLPTYRDHSVNLVNRLAYLWHEPRRGDIVAIRFSHFETNGLGGLEQVASRLEPPHVMLLKRIVGLPGETVAFLDGRVVINGEPLDEPYEDAQKFPCDWNRAPVTLGPGEYLVVGDNRSMPQEDHTFGECERNRIVGKALL